MKRRHSIHKVLVVASLPALVFASVHAASAQDPNTFAAPTSSPAAPPPRVPTRIIVPPDILKLEQTGSVNPDWRQAREDAKGRLARLAGGKEGQSFGFPKVPKANDLRVLDPLPEAVVYVDELRRYDGTGDPEKVLHRLERLTFPVLLGNAVVSSFTLARLQGTWEPVSYGSSTLIQAVYGARLRAASPKQGPSLVHGGKQADYTIVSVTGLSMTFVAAKGSQGLYLTPLYDRKRLGFVAGVPQLAKQVFLKLRADADSYRGFPPPP